MAMRERDRFRMSPVLACVTALLALGVVLLTPAGPPAIAGPPPSPVEEFVRVVDGGFSFEGRPVHVAGVNCYYLMTFAADPALRPRVDEVLTEARDMGLTLIRTWGFNDGSGWNALQTAPGVYDETVFLGLDYVLDRCRALGLRVVLPLVNNWVDYGGMDQYVAWSPTATTHDQFYTDSNCRAMYRDHASAMINRVNSMNGIRYGDDPTIFAWELANEPRCPSDKTGNTLVAWITEMSAYLKSEDPNHMVSVGSEGFYDDNSGPWYLNGWEGVDFIRDHQVADIDYAGAHCWPDSWSLNLATTMAFLSRQITDARDVIQKPFMLGEFGKQRDAVAGAAAVSHYDPETYFSPGVTPYRVPGAEPVRVDRANAARPYLSAERSAAPGPASSKGAPSARASGSAAVASANNTATRDLFLTAWYDSLLTHECGGSSFWISYDDAYPDYDGFGVYYPADTSTVAVITAHAEAMAALGRVAVPPTPRSPVLALGPSRPNPFHGSSRIRFSLSPEAAAQPVSLTVIDVSGRLVRRLVYERLDPGPHDMSWDGRNETGRRAPPGAYFFILRAGRETAARKAILLR